MLRLVIFINIVTYRYTHRRTSKGRRHSSCTAQVCPTFRVRAHGHGYACFRDEQLLAKKSVRVFASGLQDACKCGGCLASYSAFCRLVTEKTDALTRNGMQTYILSQTNNG